MPAQVYLEISIGDQAAADRSWATYQLSKSYYEKVGGQLGLAETSFDALEEEHIELLSESFAADPSWNTKGTFSARLPMIVEAGRLVLDLFKEAPKATENFTSLCSGKKGSSKSSGKPLHFKGCHFHRIVTGFCAQGGDIVRGDGSGGDSIYGGKFNDEKPALKLKHDAAGILSMANSDAEAASPDGKPKVPVWISDCGVLM